MKVIQRTVDDPTSSYFMFRESTDQPNIYDN